MINGRPVEEEYIGSIDAGHLIATLREVQQANKANERELKKLWPLVDEINDHASRLEHVTDDENGINNNVKGTNSNRVVVLRRP